MGQDSIAEIVGMGNALLDMEFHVTDEALAALNVDKGLMTLIDAKRHGELLEKIHAMPHITASGGSVANSIATASQLGAACYLSCRVANDRAGAQYAFNLQEAKVGNSYVNGINIEGVSGKCLALITPDAERSMLSYLGVSADFCKDDLDVEKIKQAKILYIEGYLVASPVSMQAILYAQKIAKDYSVKVAFSLSDVNMVKLFREQVDTVLENGVDILFSNDQEAEVYIGKKSLAEKQQELLKTAKTVVITHGKKGATVCTRDESITIPAIPVDVVDTLGAGDAFAGGFLAAYVAGSNLKNCLQQASTVAGHIVSKDGPRFTQNEINSIKDELVFC